MVSFMWVRYMFFVSLSILMTYLKFLYCFAVRELDIPGEIHDRKTYPFEFSTVEMPYESYRGLNVQLR